MHTPTTIIIDPDTVTVVLTDTENSREISRAAIDEIAWRLESELDRLGIEGVEVEREYRTTGRHDDSSDFGTALAAVLIDQCDEIRTALGLVVLS